MPANFCTAAAFFLLQILSSDGRTFDLADAWGETLPLDVFGKDLKMTLRLVNESHGAPQQ